MESKYVAQMQEVILFQGMKEEEIAKVLRCLNAHTRQYPKGSYIYMHGDHFEEIGIVLSGKITVDRAYQNSSVLTMDILEKNDTFGEDIVCLGKGQAPYSLRASTPSEVLYINGSKLTHPSSVKCEYRSHVILNMLKRVAEYSMYVNKRMKYLSILSLKKRVITLLLDHHQEAATDIFQIRMNREEMADYLNGTRSALCRILTELKKEKLIDYHKTSFTVKDEEGLRGKLDEAR